ncbi:AI-2E family transporter [Ethanoligenens sp.]|uniref:AI-2E family transporter n=1 Tax=Ethanoligenens sp. TaxID=2099655 RepID=UPI0039E8CBD2
METLFAFFKKPYVRRILIFIAIIVVLVWLRKMLSIFLLTFMFIYFGNSAEKVVSGLYLKLFKRKTNPRVVVIILYALVILALVILMWIYIPVIVHQIGDLITSMNKTFASTPKTAITDSSQFSLQSIVSFVSGHVDISKYLANGGTTIVQFLSNIGTASVNIFMALILSLFFLLGKSSVRAFLRQFKGSKLHWMYEDMRYFTKKFSNSFGSVIQTQLLISCINTVISTVVLFIMGFPSVIGLAAMIFVLGLVPVAGVFISLIPLCIVGYATGGVTKVIWVLILVAVLHALEGYVLNPKLMSNKTQLPVFITFLVLLIAEHVIGLWGLVIGLPLAVFLLDVLEVLPQDGGKSTRLPPFPRFSARERHD